MKAMRVVRQSGDVYLIHQHPTIAGFMKRRLGDNSGTTDHKMLWNYFEPRKRWEAVCELLDVIFYCEGVP